MKLHRRPRTVPWVLCCLVAAQGLRAQAVPSDSLRRPGPPVLGLVWLGDELDAVPPGKWASAASFRLPSRDSGQIIARFGQVEAGIALRLEVPGPVRASGPARARIRFEIQDTASILLPPVGWGHQFGFETLADPDACGALGGGDSTVVADCRDWYASQQERRRDLERLLTGTWELDPGIRPSVRRWGGDRFRAPIGTGGWSALAPTAEPRIVAVRPGGPDEGDRIDVLVPWAALPPVRSPTLDALAIRVGTSHPLEASMHPMIGELARPVERAVTSCGYAFRELLLAGGDRRSPHLASGDAVWLVRPDTARRIDRVFALDHDARGYQYTPDPDSHSPALYEAVFFERELADGRHLCGPRPRISSGTGMVPSVRRSSGPATFPGPWLSPEPLDIERAGEGRTLVWQGPRVYWSYFGSGQCGGCPRVDFHVLEVDQVSDSLRPVFAHSTISDGGFREVEYDVAADRSMISVFESAPAATGNGDEFEVIWTRRDFCRRDGPEGLSYEACGEEAGVPEPPSTVRDEIARLSRAGRGG